MKRLSSLRRSALIALIVVWTGCAGNETSPEVSPINQCVTDAECSQYGGICDPELLACVSADVNTLETLVITVSDPQLGSVGEHHFDLDETDVSEPFDLTVSEPYVLRGQVVDHRNELGVIAARLTFNRQSQFENFEPEPVHTESSESVSEDGQGNLYNYQVKLVPGRYEIEVEVEPVQEDGVHAAVQPYYPQRRSCAVPSEQCETTFEYVDASGEIESFVIGPEGDPIGGVTVYAYDVNDGRRISNKATTRCKHDDPLNCGRFTITVPETTDEFRLHLSGSKTQPLLPILELGPFSFSLDKTGDRRIRFDDDEIGNMIFSPHEEAVLYNAVIEGTGRDGALRPLVGATVQLRSVVDDLWISTDGVFVLEATTDELGAIVAVDEGLRDRDTGIGIYIVPGEYEVTIIPPSESEHSTLETQIVVEPEGEGDVPEPQVLAVGSRALITGVIRSPDGRLVPHTQIEAVSIDGRTFVAESDDVGAFSMFVDRTAYTVTAIPPEGSMLTRARITGVSALDDLTLDIDVGWGALISGDIMSAATNEPVESAVVEGFYARQGDPDDPTLYLIPIGGFTTVDDGRFLILLPQWEMY